MSCKDRNGNLVFDGSDNQLKSINFLYNNVLGKQILKICTNPIISKIGGALLNASISRVAIKSFIKNNNIDMSQFENKKFSSYNDFFTRKILSDARSIDTSSDAFISQCDSKLSIYKIDEDSIFNIKNNDYSLLSLLQTEEISIDDKKINLLNDFKGGFLMLFRLSVDDYHRYCFCDNGNLHFVKKIEGKLNTVNPLALEHRQVYKENSREISLLRSENFDDLIIIEVGALMVGKIVNTVTSGKVYKGKEKGRFEFGGSTIIVCIKKDIIDFDEDIILNSKNGFETKVYYGEKIGSLKK